MLVGLADVQLCQMMQRCLAPFLRTSPLPSKPILPNMKGVDTGPCCPGK